MSTKALEKRRRAVAHWEKRIASSNAKIKRQEDLIAKYEGIIEDKRTKIANERSGQGRINQHLAKAREAVARIEARQ